MDSPCEHDSTRENAARGVRLHFLRGPEPLAPDQAQSWPGHWVGDIFLIEVFACDTLAF